MSAEQVEPDTSFLDAGFLDEGDPCASPRGFRRALGAFATGVAVVTAAAAGREAYVTVNSFASVSLDPPLVLWSLRRVSHSLDVFRTASHFAVNVLAADQVEIASRHARSSPDPHPPERGRTGRGGAPLLDGVAAVFECRNHAEHDGGDHVVMLGEVERYACFDRAGLLFAQGRYALAIDHPEADPPNASETPALQSLDDSLLPLVLRAYRGLSSAFDRDREAMGLDLDQSKVLSWLVAHGSGATSAIARHTLLGASATEDAVAALVGRGLAEADRSETVVVTPAGRDTMAALTAHAAALEGQRLTGFDSSEIAVARRILAAVAHGA